MCKGTLNTEVAACLAGSGKLTERCASTRVRRVLFLEHRRLCLQLGHANIPTTPGANQKLRHRRSRHTCRECEWSRRATTTGHETKRRRVAGPEHHHITSGSRGMHKLCRASLYRLAEANGTGANPSPSTVPNESKPHVERRKYSLQLAHCPVQLVTPVACSRKTRGTKDESQHDINPGHFAE